MKIIKDNFHQKEDDQKNIVCKCQECESEFAVNTEDTFIGAFGDPHVVCPCCGSVTVANGVGKSILTKDNILYPKHFCRINRDDCDVIYDDEEIQDIIRDGIAYLEDDKTIPYYSMFFGENYLFITRDKDKEEYEIVISKDHYVSVVPFDNKEK